MSETTRILLVRHGRTTDELNERLIGATDIALSHEGERAASRLALGLCGLRLACVYASPARRAVATAAPLARRVGLEVLVEPALREIDFGELDGMRLEDIERAHPGVYAEWIEAPTRVRFPGGESFAALQARVLGALEAIRARHRGEVVAVVAHAGPIRAILADCLGMPAEAVFRLEIRHAEVTVVEWAQPTPVVRVLNAQPSEVTRVLSAPSPRAASTPASRLERPLLPSGFDDSRAAARRDQPDGWRFAEAELAAVWHAISERRDIRRFRPDALPDDAVRRLLEAAHRAPSVGLMQPWRFVLVRSQETKAAMQSLAARERLVQAQHFGDRARAYLDLKIEGIREAPLSICVCCDRTAGGREVLGRHTIPDTDLYSTCLAIENLWLVARAEGIGVGWVSFYRPDDVRALLGLPEHVVPVAWLCVGYPDERPERPGLEAAGWRQRGPLDDLVHLERWGALTTPTESLSAEGLAAPTRAAGTPSWLRPLLSAVAPGDQAGAASVRDATDELVKPAGSLGSLELLVERFALACGAPPPMHPRAAIAVFAASDGVAAHGVSLYPARVGSQVAAAAARGETAIGVLAEALGAELVIADVGLAGPKLDGVLDLRVAEGSADPTRGPALSKRELREALEAGHGLGRELARRCDILVVGEIGIGNTTVAAALLCALCGLSPKEACGRGTGLDVQGVARKQAVVAAALERNAPSPEDALECLRTVGGLELAALVGALLGAAGERRPILLDGFATGVAALAGCRLRPALRDYLIAGHRSSEPAHGRVLTELGLEPLLDLRLRLGEASGAALALPLVGLAAELHARMSRFEQAGVEGPGRSPLGRRAGVPSSGSSRA